MRMRALLAVLLVVAAILGTAQLSGAFSWLPHEAAKPVPAGQAPAQTGSKRHPVLGDSEKAWRRYFGPPTKDSGNGSDNWLPCPRDPRNVRIVASVLLGQILFIDGFWCHDGARPTAGHNLVDAMQFFPRDAKRRGEVSTPQGVDLEYYSATLAKSPFDQASGDCNGLPVQAGLFTINLNFNGDGDWQLATGTCA